MTERKESVATGEEDDDFLLFEEKRSSAGSQPAVFRRTAPSPSGIGMLIRIAILLLFLFSLAGLGYYYFAGTIAPPASTPAPEVAARPDATAKGVISPANPDLSAELTVSSGPVEVPPQTQSDIEAPREEIPTAAPVSNMSGKTPAARKSTPKVKPAMVAKKSVPAGATPAAEYTLEAGVFLLKPKMEKAKILIRKLGYEPELTTLTKETEMTRLLVGTFSPAEARAFLSDLKSRVPEAFMLIEGERASVFAGSFSVPVEAGKMADRLTAEGIITEAVVVKLPMTMHRVTFGSFTDREKARNAAERAMAGGLDTVLIKRL